MVEVEVEHDYTANEPDELNIKKGDIIKDVIKKPGGWWEGTLNDRRGMFPDNFVKVIDHDIVLRSKKELNRIRQCRVIFSYAQDHEDELNLKLGEIINIVGEEEEGWWRGVLNGKEGVFPSNFVEEITPLSPRPKPNSREDLLRLHDDAPTLPAKPAKHLYRAHFSYKAENEDELTLKEGDIITLISKEGQDPGWWRGELNGKIGVFPDNFVIPYQNSTGDKKQIHKPTEPSAIKPSQASQRKSLEIKKPEPPRSTPPVPGKKPLMPIKKSPSSSSSGGGLFSKLKDKIVDAVDGATGSKVKEGGVKEVEHATAPTGQSGAGGNVFDQVERRPLLSDVRAKRARAPGRRPPTTILKEDDEEPSPALPNGNAVDHSAKLEDSFKSEISYSSENLDNSSSSEVDANETKPKLREWEKHRAPWLEEMKMNQAKRTSVSPVPDSKQHKPPQDADGSSKSSQNSPAEKEVNIVDMSKSMSEIKLSSGAVKVEKVPSIRSKPIVTPPPAKPVLGSTPPSSFPPKTTPPLAKPSFRLKQESQETVSQHTFSSNFSHSTERVSTSASVLKEQHQITPKQFQEVLDRLARLEIKCDRQAQQIEELKNKLQIESELRMMLQERVIQNNVQV